MRRALGLVILLATLAGCSSSPTAPSTDSGDGTSPDLRVTAFTASVNIPIEFLVFIPCADGGAGEVVDFAGTLHDLFHVTINGNNFILKFHDQPQGIFGVGESTGDKYKATGVTQEVTRSGTVGFTDSFVNNFKIIGPGPANNLLIHENVYVTVNANGTVTSTHDHFSIQCK
jgi:hypothetical protein